MARWPRSWSCSDVRRLGTGDCSAGQSRRANRRSSGDDLQGPREDLDHQLAHIGLGAGEDLTVRVDEQGTVGLKLQSSERPQMNLPEPTMGAPHEFRYQTEHHQPADVIT